MCFAGRSSEGPRHARYAAPAAAIWLGVFVGVMAYAYAQGLKIDCERFGPGEPIHEKTPARAGLLLGVSLTLTFLALRQRGLPRAA